MLVFVNNDLYAADYANIEVRKYDKQYKPQATIERLFERVASMNGWGLTFRGCGDRLIIIGCPRLEHGFREFQSEFTGSKWMTASLELALTKSFVFFLCIIVLSLLMLKKWYQQLILIFLIYAFN